MKKSNRLDKVCIEKILRYAETIRMAYDTYNIKNADDLEDNAICHLAITQVISNIYALRQKIQQETLAKAPIFSGMKARMKATRNIASHEYGELDFRMVYKLAAKLFDPQTINELEAAKNGISDDFESDSPS